ncbi:hypothetical protein [Brevundimonas aurifodinae]|uniref:Uncharacterized protein n=1 Tax=Brevundimonas aurifodinae TaxID=1508312 RepID=A0ABV1NQ11_9CAUL
MTALLLTGEPSHGCPTTGAQWLISRRSGDRRGIVEIGQARHGRLVFGQSDGRGGLASGRRGAAATTRGHAFGTRAAPIAFSWYPECA